MPRSAAQKTESHRSHGRAPDVASIVARRLAEELSSALLAADDQSLGISLCERVLREIGVGVEVLHPIDAPPSVLASALAHRIAEILERGGTEIDESRPLVVRRGNGAGGQCQ
jgi:hypothetical protein